MNVYKGDGTLLSGFKAFGDGNPSGAVRLATVDVDNNGSKEIITGHDVGGSSWVCVYEGDGTMKNCFQAFGKDNKSGAIRIK